MFQKLTIHILVVTALIVSMQTEIKAPATGLQQENVIQVNSLEDGIIPDSNCTLREAIQAANTNTAVAGCPAGTSGMDHILLPYGTIKITVTVPEGTEDHNLSGDFDIQSSMTITGQGQTTLDGDNKDRIIDVHPSVTNLILEDLTLRNGFVGDWNCNETCTTERRGGGGIYNSGTLLLRDIRLFDNWLDFGTHGSGGAIYNAGYLSSEGFLSIDGNYTVGVGGGIYNTGTLILRDVYFSDNHATVMGALYSTGEVTITNATFTNNSAGYGGVIIGSAEGTLAINNAVVSDNESTESSLIVNSGEMFLRKVIFRKNTGSDSIVSSQGILNLKDVHFDSNQSTWSVTVSGQANINRTVISNSAGGVAQWDGQVSIYNSTITDIFGLNRTYEKSGPIRAYGGTMSLNHVTISETTGTPALVVDGGLVAVRNTIIADSYAADQPGMISDCEVVSGTMVSDGYNLISRVDGCGWVSNTGDQLGTLAHPIDPKLGPLKDNGGFAPTRMLLVGSPAINAGDPVNYLKEDQREVVRPQGGRADIGAVEFSSFKYVFLPTLRK